jgi:hypothetical protein
LTVHIDTVRLNVCGNKNFLIGVGVGDLFASDGVVGLRMILQWDRSTFDIEDQVLTGGDALGAGFSYKSVIKDPVQGEMIIEMGDTSLRPVSGSGKPLFYLKGQVTAPDTVAPPLGWILVESLTFESSTNFSPIDYSQAGFVEVERDTSAAFTGVLSVGAGSFDTAQVDTVTLTTQNLRNHRVHDIAFVLKADTSRYGFVDTIETGTLAASGTWNTKEVRITSDSIVGLLTAGSDLISDGALLKVVLRRKTDSAFSSTLDVSRFTINQQSCLGNLLWQGSQVSAKAIVKDTSTSVVEDQRKGGVEEVRIVAESNGSSIAIATGSLEVSDVEIFDINGRMLPVQQLERLGASTLRVRLATPPPSGIYFAGLRGRNEIVYKQFTLIK